MQQAGLIKRTKLTPANLNPRSMPGRMTRIGRAHMTRMWGWPIGDVMGLSMTPGNGLLVGGIAGVVIGGIIGLVTKSSPLLWAVGGGVVLGGYGALRGVGR